MLLNGSRSLIGLLAVGSFFWALPAQAVPAECSGTWLERFYNSGIQQGLNLVDMAWAGIEGDCDRLEEFEELVMNNLMDYAPPTSEYGFCRYLGHVEGTLLGVDDKYDACADQCCNEGRFIAEISAISYCQLSFWTGGLQTADNFERLPVQYCGLVFQICCDPTFNTTTYTYVDDQWDDPDTIDVNEGDCRLYTDQGELDPVTGKPKWAEVWNQVRSIQCGYDIVEEPDTDEE